MTSDKPQMKLQYNTIQYRLFWTGMSASIQSVCCRMLVNCMLRHNVMSVEVASGCLCCRTEKLTGGGRGDGVLYKSTVLRDK